MVIKETHQADSWYYLLKDLMFLERSHVLVVPKLPILSALKYAPLSLSGTLGPGRVVAVPVID